MSRRRTPSPAERIAPKILQKQQIRRKKLLIALDKPESRRTIGGTAGMGVQAETDYG